MRFFVDGFHEHGTYDDDSDLLAADLPFGAGREPCQVSGFNVRAPEAKVISAHLHRANRNGPNSGLNGDRA